MKPDPQRLAPPLLAWFDRAKRHMPWRGTREPYRIWVSEIMLQQTQVATVIPYFERFMHAFPDVKALAEASLDDVLALWAGLGYYSRARRLHEAAGRVVNELGGRFPETAEGLRELPGIGAYTAGAIASIAFGERVPAIDGNASRVLARVFLVRGDVKKGRAAARIAKLGAAAVPAGRPGDYNQALMELGSQTCRPESPRCGDCCLGALCLARLVGRQDSVPSRRKRRPVRAVETVAGIVVRNGRILIAQRPPEGVWGGLWELPNAEVDDGDAASVLGELLRREFGLEVPACEQLATLKHGIMDQRISLTVFRCGVSGRTQARRHVAAKWVRPDEADAHALPAPHRKALRMTRGAGSK